MEDKYAKEIAKELKLIRLELQKVNKTSNKISIDGEEVANVVEKSMAMKERAKGAFAGDQVTIK